MDSSRLQNRVQGKVIGRGQQEYEPAWEANWNQLRPQRYPDVIVQAASDRDVVEAVKFAAESELKIAVRRGGNTWCGTPLRKGGMLIDLAWLTEVKIDPVARTAAIQPIISNLDMLRLLEPYQLAFPVGHCPQVKASGYLLSGGIAWNAGCWGHGCLSVSGVEMVTADGTLLTANPEQNQELFWAARGAGAGTFVVATRFHLKLYPRPQAIHSSTYYYPLSTMHQAAEWFSGVLEQMPRNVEMTLWLVSAPADIAERCRSDNGKVFMVTATVFAETRQEASDTLAVLERCPHQSLRKSVAEHTPFETLFAISGSMWPEFHRNKVESVWSNSSPADILSALGAHFTAAPNPKALILFALYPGWATGVPRPPDMALSMSARVYGGPWTIWESSLDDVANIEWHRKCCEILKPFVCGRYLGESDIIDDPSREQEAFSPANWKRLQELKAKYDPDGRFHGLFGGL
jgi:FAD/FMN-containing dehydrogenase